MESYIEAYRKGTLDKSDLAMLGHNLSNLHFYVHNGHIDQSLAPLVQSILGNKRTSKRAIKFFDAYKIIDSFSQLSEKEADVLSRYYGLYDDKLQPLHEIAKDHRISATMAGTIARRARIKLKQRPTSNSFLPIYDESMVEEQYLSDEEKNAHTSILDTIYSSNLIFIPDKDFSQEPYDIDPSELKDMISELCAIQENSLQRKSNPESNTSIAQAAVQSDRTAVPPPLLEEPTHLEKLRDLRKKKSTQSAQLHQAVLNSQNDSHALDQEHSN